MLYNSNAYVLHRLAAALDRAADQLLQTNLSISYSRALFLFVLQYHGSIIQHELAVALGYSDPAVSTMLLELTREGYVTTEKSPEHGRKRLVTLTPKGSEIITKGRSLLDEHFDQLLEIAGVDAQQYREETERIYAALAVKMKKELS